jgi:hypothetical protein
MSSSSAHPLSNDQHDPLINKENDYRADIESKLTKNESEKTTTKSEETSFNTQAFWMVVWMTKYV